MNAKWNLPPGVTQRDLDSQIEQEQDEQQSREEARAEWASREDKARITLIRKLDCFKANWYLWACEKEMPDGEIKTGSVQADMTGDLIAVETFEADE